MQSARFIAEQNDAFYLFTGEAGMRLWQHLCFRLLLYFDTQLNWPPGKAAEKSFCLYFLLSSKLASSLTILCFWKWFWSCGSIHQELHWDKWLLAFKSRNSCQTVKKNPNFFVFYLHTSLNACGSKDGLRTEFHFLEHTVRVEAYSWCISTMLNNRQGEPPQILAALQWSNMVRGLATESVGFQTDCEECRFLMAVNSPFLSSLEQLSFMSLRNWLIK